MRFKPPAFTGVVHLLPLPGSPRWGGSMGDVVERAIQDADAYAAGGAGALVVENYGDLPFSAGAVPPETVAAMAAVATAIKVAVDLPLGFNVLRNDGAAALALCAACEGEFVRVNVLTGAALTDQGLVEGDAFNLLRSRGWLCPEAAVLADVQVKHARPLTPQPIAEAARDAWERGLADALIVSGNRTGGAVDPADLRAVREACPGARLLVGSGVDAAGARALLELADGLIVGSSLKRDGRIGNPVDAKRVAELAAAIGA